MIDYHQPEYYRFNEDSLALVRRIQKTVKKTQHILDLGAGCGVIGLELASFYHPETLTLLEVQKDYQKCLDGNLKLFLPAGTKCHIVYTSFGAWQPSKRYDLIACNPPYYLPGHGEKSQDERRAVARSFQVDGWEILLQKISESLSKDGVAWIVIKNNSEILNEVKKYTHNFKVNFETEGKLVFVILSRLHED